MTPAEAIFVLIGIAIIALVAWFFQWCAERALAPDHVPQPVRLAIWGIAALAALLVVLGAFDIGGVPTVIDVD
jgi:hypothetical protein